jgi:hypothetical protein
LRKKINRNEGITKWTEFPKRISNKNYSKKRKSVANSRDCRRKNCWTVTNQKINKINHIKTQQIRRIIREYGKKL